MKQKLQNLADFILPQPKHSVLLGPAVAVILGIIIARYNYISASTIIAVFIIAAALAVTALLIPKSAKTLPTANAIAFAAILLTAVALGTARCSRVQRLFPTNHILRYCRGEKRIATIRGTIISEPYVTSDTSTFSRFNFTHRPAVGLQLQCTEALTSSGFQRVQGLLQVYITPPKLNLRQGQQIEIFGRLSLRSTPDNPGQYDPANLHHSSGVLAALNANTTEAVTILNSPPRLSLLARLQAKLQSIAHASLNADADFANQPSQNPLEKQSIASPQNVNAFLNALLLGQRYQLPQRVNEIFIRTGTIHFLAISGLHLGLFIAFIWHIGTWLNFPRLVKGLTTLAMLAVFLLIVPARPPIIRAAIIAATFCIAYITKRKTNPLNTLALAVIIVLILHPVDLFSPGFQLSFVVTAAILILAIPIYRRSPLELYHAIRNKTHPIIITPELLWLDSTWQKLKFRIKKYTWGLLVICVVAWLASMPLLAWHFNRVPLWSVATSFILAPIIALTVLLGFTKIILVSMVAIFQPMLSPMLNFFAAASLHITSLLAKLPANSINTGRPPLSAIVIFYILLTLTAYAIYHRSIAWTRRLTAAVILCLLIAAAFLIAHPLLSTNRTICHTLAVGHGNAVIITLANNRTIAYDAGSLTNFNVANRIIIPFLRHAAIGRIDALFVSHTDIDHYAGVVDLCSNFSVSMVYLNTPGQSHEKF